MNNQGQTSTVPPEYYNIAEAIDRHADGEEKIAVYWENDQGDTQTITYQELRKKSNQFANALKDLGLKQGDVIFIMLPRVIENYIAHLGGLKLGLTILPGSEMLMPKDLLYRLENSKAKVVVSYAALTERVDSLRHELKHLAHFISVGHPAEGWMNYEDLIQDASLEFQTVQTRSEDIAFLNYTSGSTGQPKGSLNSHRLEYTFISTVMKCWMDLRKDDIVWVSTSPGWALWQDCAFISTLGMGASGLSYFGKFDPLKHLELIGKYKVNVLCGAATEFRQLAKVERLNEYDFPHLRHALSAGEPLNEQVIAAFKNNLKIDLRDGYGQTETSILVANLAGIKVKPGSMGQPLEGSLVAIVDEKGNPVSPGVVGEIVVHRSSPFLFNGYLNDPVRTEACFSGDWYKTNDRARMDEDGYFWYEGRSDDIIISAGYTIGPTEVEDALNSHVKVKESAVVASPDEVRGAIVKAFIVLKDPEQASEMLVKELQEHARSITAPYKYPREIEFVDDLPKSVSGKIRRGELRKLEQLRKKGVGI